MVFPRPLPRGGRIGICSPAGPVQTERLRRSIRALEDGGFEVVVSAAAYDNYGLFSAPDDIRRRELEEMFERDDIDAVLTSRGGVGTSRLLETVDTKILARSAKPFLSFSDLTALQWWLFKNDDFVTYTGPLAVEWEDGVTPSSRQQAVRMLCRESSGDLIGDLPTDQVRVLRGTGTIGGRLMPGNLSMITTLLGTPYMPELRDTILMIEDISEPPHRVDRMLFHLRNAGVLDHLAGLFAGDFGYAADSQKNENLRTSLLDATRGHEYPVVMGLPFGHGMERMTLPIGVGATFDLEEIRFTADLPLLESA